MNLYSIRLDLPDYLSIFYILMHLLISTESHPDHTIQRLTGIMPSSAVAVIDEHKQEGVLYLDSRYSSRKISPRSGWTFAIQPRSPWWSFLSKDATYILWPHCSIATLHQLEKIWYTIQVAANPWWAQHRVVKSPDESALMKACYRKSLQVLTCIQRQIDDWSIRTKPCLELRGDCIAYAMSLWLTWEAFEMIVATGVQTASPHLLTDTTLIGEWPLLIDMGWKWQGYCSDMTRCRWIGATDADDYAEWKLIYECVQKAKEVCVRDARPWMTGQQIDALARDVIVEQWYGEYFTHSTGHGIGLEVHELPWVTHTHRGDQSVQEGMCITIEPGVYLPGRFGVRLEDSYMMSEDWLHILDAW